MLRPLPARLPSRVTAGALSDAPVTLVTGPVGAYAAEALAAVLDGQGRWRRAVWLRTHARRPELLAAQLAGACMHRWAGSDSGDNIPLQAALHLAPEGSTVVIELGGRATPRIGRLLREIRAVVMARAGSVVVVTARRSDRWVLPHDALVAAEAIAEPATDAAGLAGDTLDRLRLLTAGRAALAQDVVEAADVWPHDAVVGAVTGRATWRGLVDHVTATLLADASDDQRAALELCVATGYCHPHIVTGDLAMATLRPWVVPLEQAWGWLRPVWRAAVVRHLRTPATDNGAVGRRPRQATGPPPAGERDRQAGVALEARMLGAFELRIDGVGVPAAPGHRGYAVLRFLLARPGRAASRDEILDEFWPEVDVAIARNRLQVAVSGVRRALRDITPAPVVEYRDGGYRIAANVTVQTDVDSFEQWLVAGATAEADGRVREALSAYRTAVMLWRGDYASDTPFEQWSMFPREHLRLRYVDALDRMSRLQLRAGQIDGCIATAQRMLDVDPSREDAHRVLMRCYAAQGRLHSALRQFELCGRALRATVDAEPSADTVRLRDAVLAGSVTPV